MALTVGGVAIDLSANAAQVISEMDKAARATQQAAAKMQSGLRTWQVGFSNAESSILGGLGRLRSAFLGVTAGLIGGFSVGALASLGKTALDNAGDLGEQARAAGLSAQALQVLEFAGAQAGLSQEQLVASIGIFSKNVGQAVSRTGEFGDVLNKQGIALRTSGGQIKSTQSLLGDYAEAIKNAGSEQEKLALLQAGFGRSGRAMINIFGEGREGIAAFAEAAAAAGLILSDSFIAQADKAGDAISALQFAASRGFQVGLIQQFSGAVSSSTDALRQARDAGEAFGQAVGTGMRAAAVAAAFVARNWRELAAAGAALAGLRLGAILAEVTIAAVGLAAAIRSGAVAMTIFNTVAGKNIFVLLAKGILAVGAALATYMALTKGSADSTADITNQLAELNDLFEASAGRTVEATDATVKHADAIREAVAEAENEKRQLRTLQAAYDEYGTAVGLVKKTIEIDNALRSKKITLAEAEASGLLKLMEANQDLQASVEALAAAKALGVDAEQLQLQIDARGRESAALREQIAILDAREKYGVAWSASVEKGIHAVEQLKGKLEEMKAAAALDDRIAQQELLLQSQGLETEEYRVQAELLRQKNQLGAEGARSLEPQIRVAEEQATELENQKALYAQINSATQTFAQTLSGGFTSAITGAQSFNDALQGMLQSLTEAIIQAAIFQAVSAALGAPGGGGAFGALFPGAAAPVPARAGGGPVSAGSTYRVGERGAEYFVPSVAGNILTQSQMAGAGAGARGGGDVYNIYADRIDPGTAARLVNTARAGAPAATVNAMSRGLVRSERRPPF